MNKLATDKALLLYAISYECIHNGKASVEGIFSAEDAINRSAKTYEEMKHCLQFLLSAGLIKQEKKEFMLTKKSGGILEMITKEESSVFKHIENLGKLLDEQFGRITIVTEPHIELSDYEIAYRNYYIKAYKTINTDS